MRGDDSASGPKPLHSNLPTLCRGGRDHYQRADDVVVIRLVLMTSAPAERWRWCSHGVSLKPPAWPQLAKRKQKPPNYRAGNHAS
jgi:hypothetical protein